MKITLITAIKWLFSARFRRQLMLQQELQNYAIQVASKKNQLLAELQQCSDPQLRQDLEEKISILEHQQQKLLEQLNQN